MDFGEEETNNPFVGSSFDVLNHEDNIDSYFDGSKSVFSNPYGPGAASHSNGKASVQHGNWSDEAGHDEREDEDYDEDDDTTNNLTEYSTLGLPVADHQSVSGAADDMVNFDDIEPEHRLDIVSTEVINGVVYYVIMLPSGNTLKRRYSDFQSLRINLVKFFPTKIIPNIPEKHTLKDYLSGNKKVKDNLIIGFRRRKFKGMLNNLSRDPTIRESIVFKKFIDPDEEIWLEVLRYAPFTLLPTNVALSSPRDPTKPNPYYSYLPIPPMAALKGFDSELNRTVFVPIERYFLAFKAELTIMERQTKKLITVLKNLTMKKVELGANFNVFSLLDNNVLVERIGQAVDLEFINMEVLIKNLIVALREPIQDLKNQCIVALQLLNFRKFKELQLNHLKNIILKKQARTSKLIMTENLHLKLDAALKQGSGDSPTIAAAVRRLELKKMRQQRGNTKSLTDEEEELLNNSAILTAPSPVKVMNARKIGQKKSLFNLFGGKLNGGNKADTHLNQQYQQSYIETKDIQLMSSQERLNELTYNKQELSKLQNCFDLLVDDSKFLNIEIEKNCHMEIVMMKSKLFKVLKNFEHNFKTFCQEANNWPRENDPQ